MACSTEFHNIYDSPVDLPPNYENGSRLNSASSGTSSVELLPLSERKSRGWHVTVLASIAIITTVFCVVLSVCVVLLFIKLEKVSDQLNRQNRTLTNRQVCLLCNELRLSPFEEENSLIDLLEVTTDSNGDQVCCANNPKQSKELFDTFFTKKNKIACIEEINAKQQISCNSSWTGYMISGGSSAHLVIGLQKTDHKNDNSLEPVRNWRVDDSSSHIHGLNLTRDRIVINETGLYVVYSQMYFSKYIPPTSPKSSSTLFHCVYRYNVIYPNGGEQLMMKSVKTFNSDPMSSHSDHTSYTAATLRLNVGDELYVKVSNISLVSRAEKASFFGVLQIA